jgi:serine/threonine protein phosphatase PrpC
MAPQIDYMVASGLLDAEQGKRHPDRNTLTSVLFGDEVPQIDCPATPLDLKAGDMLIVASDGLQFLSDAEISDVLRDYQSAPSAAIADRLLERVETLDDPEQDNVSFSVVKILERRPQVRSVDDRELLQGISRVG